MRISRVVASALPGVEEARALHRHARQQGDPARRRHPGAGKAMARRPAMISSWHCGRRDDAAAQAALGKALEAPHRSAGRRGQRRHDVRTRARSIRSRRAGRCRTPTSAAHLGARGISPPPRPRSALAARGLHVMIFSDNVPIEEEAGRSSQMRGARARPQMVMGPDCGTAIIAGTPLAFANAGCRSGDIGIIGASGTGVSRKCRA